jgi:heparanase
MNTIRYIEFCMLGALAVLGIAACSTTTPSGRPPLSLAPATMPRVGAVDERFQSYNIEMLEVTGGDFWKPYSKTQNAGPKPAQATSSVPAGMNPDMYEFRPPIDLTNPRRRKLAGALGPAYVRVSGTWANTAFFCDANGPAPKTPPAGFNGVLTRQHWKGVVDFANAVNAKIVTSFATGVGTRNAADVWTPKDASRFLAYTRLIGGDIVAAEFMNEPTAAAMGGAPKGYDAASYGRDLAVFRPFIKKTAPNLIILGPGSVGEGGTLAMPARMLRTEDLLKAAGPVFDVFSYHFYGAVSNRCASPGAKDLTTEDAALSDEWLSRTNTVEAFYAALRDRFEPGKPLWITETADAACGGNPWASTFLDSFRYLNQLGSVAQRGVQVVMHNTLDASDYGLLDENTLTPRPDYWAALLWRKLMGTTVLNPDASVAPGLHLYAHCLRGHPGGVTILVINASRTATQSGEFPAESERYTLTAAQLTGADVQLNGRELKLVGDDSLPQLTGVPVGSGNLTFAPASITFLAIPNANNPSCRSDQ